MIERRAPGTVDRAVPGEHARMSLALWLRQGRAGRGMSVADVARVTKIQPRILERLESGRLEGLPADVFVRGFVKSIARCLGLDEGEAVSRYSACGRGDVAPTTAAVSARAFVETMGELAPSAARAAAAPRLLRDPASAEKIEVIDVSDVPDAVGAAAEAETTHGVAAAESVSEGAADADVEVDIEVELAEGSARLEAMPQLAAGTAESALVVADAAEAQVAAVEVAAVEVATVEVATDAAAKKKRTRKPKASASPTTGRKRKKAAAELLPVVSEPIVAAVAAAPRTETATATIEAAPVIPTTPAIEIEVEPALAVAPAMVVTPSSETAQSVDVASGAELAPVAELEPVADVLAADAHDAAAIDVVASTEAVPEIADSARWIPKMPPVAQSVPWRRPSFAAAAPQPTLVIDDADPDRAEREREDRHESHSRSLRSFLPPILLDREDRSARQGGLTLAVIILLIAATLTLSYLMRRPGSSGDGMTERATATSHVG